MNLEEEFVLENVARFFLNALNDDDEDNNVHDDAGDKWVIVPVDVRAFQLMGDPAFRLHFRMTRVTFEALTQVVGNYMVENNLMQRERVSLDLMMMHTLWILATPDSFRSVALQFGVHKSIIHRHYLMIVSVLCGIAPQYIKWPSLNERHIIENAFRAYSGFPGIVGCVDGTYIVVTAPTVQPRRYIDRHHQYSINVQAVCDHKLVIRDIYVGEAGSLTDARVFRRSPLCRQLLMNPNMLEPHQHIIGDSIYMLTDKLLTPHRNNGHLDRWKKLYNYLLCRCRARIEHCFGKLFSQWRRLKFMHSFNFEYTMEHGAAAAADDDPDNEVDDEQDEVFEHLLEGDFDHLPQEFLNNHPLVQRMQEGKVYGAEKRNQLVTYFRNLREQQLL